LLRWRIASSIKCCTRRPPGFASAPKKAITSPTFTPCASFLTWKLKAWMNNPAHPLRVGTRASALARWQTQHISDLLRQAWPGLEIDIQTITTQGDQKLDTPLPLIGGKGVFTAELEAALRRQEIDFAVHSLKDLPTE